MGFITQTTANDPDLDFAFSVDIGRCTCSDNLIDTFYAASFDPDPYTAPISISCATADDAQNTCVCTEDGQCYRPFGNVDFVLPEVFCDAGSSQRDTIFIGRRIGDPLADFRRMSRICISPMHHGGRSQRRAVQRSRRLGGIQMLTAGHAGKPHADGLELAVL